MSEDGQDVCILITTALWPTTAGAASVLAAVAPTATAPPFSSLRRDRVLFSVVSFTAFLPKDVNRLTCDPVDRRLAAAPARSEEHTSELQSLMRISYAVFCLKKKTSKQTIINND